MPLRSRGRLFVALLLAAMAAPAPARPEGAPTGPAAPVSPPRIREPHAAPSLERYRNAPLAFVPNEGQTDPRVRYVARAGGATFWFTATEAVFAFTGDRQGTALRLRFSDANPAPVIEGQQPGRGRINYFRGNDPARWRQGLPTYGELVYRELWPGIDMAVRGAEGRLKYEFVVRPGASVEKIGLRYEGADRLRLDAQGQLLVRTAAGTLTDERPTSYQLIDGRRVAVESRYRLGKRGSYGFALGAYDRRQPIVIDPGLVFSTFLGGQGDDRGGGIALDGAGSIYVAGTTNSSDFPTTAGAFDRSRNGNYDVFVTKLDATGSVLLFSTFLGGTSSDSLSGFAVDAAGGVYVSGITQSTDFPTTPGAFDTSFNGGPAVLPYDAFAAKLDPTGSTLVYSTYLGGSDTDQALGLAVDGSGSAYLVGQTKSPEFPTTAGALDTTMSGTGDAFVTKLDPTGSHLVYSTHLGGPSATDDGAFAQAVAVDGAGNAFVVGATDTPDFPTTPGAFATHHAGVWDAFVAKLDPTGSSLRYSTFLGGSTYDFGYGVAIDDEGHAYVTGVTFSVDYPMTSGAFDTTFNNGGDAFVTKLDATGSALMYSTYLGGSVNDQGDSIAIDGAGIAYVTGQTNSPNYPSTAGALDTSFNGMLDAFVTKLNAAGSALLYSTYLGGASQDFGSDIKVDAAGNAYVTAVSQSPDFPTTAGAFDPSQNGNNDAIVAKLDMRPISSLALSPAAATNAVATNHTVTAHLAEGNPSAEDRLVRFAVGGSVTAEGTCRTDAAGACSFTYAGPPFPGTDAISAFADANENGMQDEGEPADTATKEWVLPDSTPGRASGWGAIPGASGRKVRFYFSARNDGELRGSCSVNDRATGTAIRCMDVTAFVVSGDDVTFYGHATVNGVATTYVIHASDKAQPGPGQDTFSIQTASGHAAAGTLTQGNIRVRE